MKKLLSVILAVVIITSAASVMGTTSVFADSQQEGVIHFNDQFLEDNRGAIEDIIEGVESYQESIDISKYNISKSEYLTLYRTFYYTRPDLFYLSNYFQYYSSGGKLTQWIPHYKYDAQTAQQKRAEFEQRAQWYLKKVRADMSDLEKALVVHDELILNSEYIFDTDVYDLMVRGQGVCYCYAGAYAYLLSKLGVNTEQVMSSAETMNHQWNKVQIDGKWYHVDVTWDDPTPDQIGRVNHTYFMLADDEFPPEEENGEIIREYDHYDYTSQFESTDHRFASYRFRSCCSRIGYAGDDFYLCDRQNNKIYKYDPDTDNTEAFKSLNFRWAATAYGEGAYWNGNYTSVDCCKDYVYYNSSSTIYACNVLTGEEITFYENTFENDIYGMYILNGKVYAKIAPDPNSSTTDEYVGDCIRRDTDYVTQSGEEISLTDEFTREADDSTNFGISNTFKNIQMLGVQKKNNSTRTIRFIAVLNNEVLKDCEDYGFIALSSGDMDRARANISALTLETANKRNVFSCKESSNNVSGEYGQYSADKKYKYITFAVKNIGDCGVAAMFYLKDANGNVYYAPYINGEGGVFNNCAVDWATIINNEGN
ncbi:MAG: transglutaminase domain-containing protein [Ruminococcus sp.]|nr:transglutaminase domain-containing protein [Ruminococcus sp.]